MQSIGRIYKILPVQLTYAAFYEYPETIDLAVSNVSADLDWTFISPAAEFEAGDRTEKFRLGSDALLVDEEGRRRISAEDLALALIDEVERSQFIRRQMTVAY